LKVGALIPIRLASERLPNKALAEICGRPVVWHLLDRVCAAKRITAKVDVVVCTTEATSDDPLARAVEEYGCSVFRGSSDDIIRRFHDAMASHGFDVVIQADGDDPLSATEYMDLTLETLLGDPALDIVTCQGLPLGVATKSLTRAAMQRVFSHYRTKRNDTGFIYFFTKTTLCRQRTVSPLSEEHILDEARLTLDYPEDLEVFKIIFENLYTPDRPPFDLGLVIRFLQARPDVMAINTGRTEEYWRRTREKAELSYVDGGGALRHV